MFGIDTVDWLTIIVYLLGITVIGVRMAKRVRSSASFFIGDRKYGKLMMIFFSFGTGTHSDQAVSVAAKSYRVGASGIWYQWLWLFASPFYWLIAPVFRRMRAVTTADYFVARYGRSVGMLFAILGTLQMMVNIGVMLRGSSAVVTAVSGGAIPPVMAVGVMAVLFTVYGIAGGLNAAIVTDFVQGLLTIVLSFLILPFALSAVGGMTGLREAINDPSMFSIVAPAGSEITVFYVVVISINALVGIVTQPQTMGMAAAGRTEMEGRIGWTCGSLVKRVCTIAWVLTGMCAIVMYAGRDVDIDHVYGLMARDLLPTIAPGLVGLFIASLLAAVMSSCDAFMVTSAALFTDHLYKPLIAPNRDDRHYILAGRIVSAVVVLGGIIFAFEFDSVVKGLEMFWKVAAMMGIAFWGGLFWRRATPAAAWAATLVSFVTWLLTEKVALFGYTLWDFNATFGEHLPSFMVWVEDGKSVLYLPWQMILYLTTGFVTCVVVSFFTKPVAKRKLDRLYECLHTPIVPGEPETKPFTLPEGVEPAPRSVLIAHPDFEIPKPSFVSVAGFVATWAVVGLLIGAFYWIIYG